jgi:hypothetical protein
MSTGNIEGKLLNANFWPACDNCLRFSACARQPQHPAYPHHWHWGREFTPFQTAISSSGPGWGRAPSDGRIQAVSPTRSPPRSSGRCYPRIGAISRSSTKKPYSNPSSTA